MKINELTIKDLDKDVEMLPLRFDVMFKSVFTKNLEVLKEFLVDVLKLNYALEELDIRILNNELSKDRRNEYGKRIDVNIVLNKDIYVETEINKEDFKLVKYRNKMYADKVSSTILESGENVRRLEKIYFYQLNLNCENKNETVGSHVIVPYDINTKEVYIDNQQIVLKYLEFYYKLYYNEPKKRTRDVIWLAALNAKNFSELYHMLKQILDKKMLNKFMKDVINMSIENFNVHDWLKDEFDEYIALKREKMALEREKIATERGLKKGIEQGNQETTTNIIKEMLKKTISLNDIRDITGKSIEEIKKIKENLSVE